MGLEIGIGYGWEAVVCSGRRIGVLGRRGVRIGEVGEWMSMVGWLYLLCRVAVELLSVTDGSMATAAATKRGAGHLLRERELLRARTTRIMTVAISHNYVRANVDGKTCCWVLV